MSKSVDVLEVLDRMLESNRRAGIAEVGDFAELIEARAAVAELIEADREYDDAIERHAKALAYCDHFDPEKGDAARALEAARVRRALAHQGISP